MHAPTEPRKLAAWIRELEHDGQIVKFYKSPEWMALRIDVLEDYHYECSDCADVGIYTPAQFVHHENEVHDRPDLALTYIMPDGTRNLTALCHACHNNRHGAYEAMMRTHANKKREPLTEERW